MRFLGFTLVSIAALMSLHLNIEIFKQFALMKWSADTLYLDWKAERALLKECRNGSDKGS